jgi:hypothetical protein
MQPVMRTETMKNVKITSRRAATVAMTVGVTLLLMAGCQSSTITITQEVTRQVEVTVLVTQPFGPQPTVSAQKTKMPPAGQPQQPLLATEQVGIAPYPDAPLCTDTGEAHDNNLFHTLWDSTRGCHYDHEHGQNPFMQKVVDTFPGLDLRTLTGDVGVGHSNPSSPMENTHKHGGDTFSLRRLCGR